MEEKMLVFLVLILGSVFVIAKPALEDAEDPGLQALICNVDAVNRYECGWLGIDEATCLKRGCCWDNSDPNAKFCYVKGNSHLPDGLCPVAPSERKECGYYGITKNECLGKSCCWDDTVPNTKWCFNQPDEPTTGCYMYHGVEGTCKYVCDPDEKKSYGMSQCKGRICCYRRQGK